MTQEYRILTDQMAAQFDEAMVKAGNERVVTDAAIADVTGVIGCYVFIVPACMHSDVRNVIDAHIRRHKRAQRAEDN